MRTGTRAREAWTHPPARSRDCQPLPNAVLGEELQLSPTPSGDRRGSTPAQGITVGTLQVATPPKP